MRKTMLAVTALAGFTATTGAFEVFKDYTPSTEIWNVTFVRVNPNRLDDYLEGIRQTWWNSCEVQKKQGTISSCEVYASETMSNRDFNLLLVVKSPNSAVRDPSEKRYNEFMAETRKMLAEDKQKKLVEGYDELRTFFGEQDFRRLTFK
jgi:hypothetical protein